MTAREKAIEAAGLTKDDIATGIAGLWENAWMDPDCRPGPDDVASAVVELIESDISPHIESALLDRIEEAVKEKRDVAQRLREAAGKGSLVDWTEATRMDTLDSVLAILTEIREEGKP